MNADKRRYVFLFFGCLSALIIFLAGAGIVHIDILPITQGSYEVPVDIPIRPEPARFRARTHMPKINEGLASGSIDLATFDPDRDLTKVYDERAWWESEHDRDDTEDDHMMHRSIEVPLRRLIELVSRNGGTLKIQDAYRPSGVHSSRSLHKEGRAVDVTCDQFPLEKLAKLCWAAGFDWVYYETRGGAHIHCSVKRNHSDQLILEANRNRR